MISENNTYLSLNYNELKVEFNAVTNVFMLEIAHITRQKYLGIIKFSASHTHNNCKEIEQFKPE